MPPRKPIKPMRLGSTSRASAGNHQAHVVVYRVIEPGVRRLILEGRAMAGNSLPCPFLWRRGSGRQGDGDALLPTSVFIGRSCPPFSSAMQQDDHGQRVPGWRPRA